MRGNRETGTLLNKRDERPAMTSLRLLAVLNGL